MKNSKAVSGEIFIFGHSIGKVMHLANRMRNYLGWFQLPLLLYTAVISTIQYFPESLAGHLPEMVVVGFVLFGIFAVVIMVIDYKFIFPSERQFMYKGTPYFDRRFDEMEKLVMSIRRGSEGTA